MKEGVGTGVTVIYYSIRVYYGFKCSSRKWWGEFQCIGHRKDRKSELTEFPCCVETCTGLVLSTRETEEEDTGTSLTSGDKDVWS